MIAYSIATLSEQVADEPAERLSPYELVLALNSPFCAPYATSPGGDHAPKALARYLDNSAGADMYRPFLPRVFNRFAELIVRVAPTKRRGRRLYHLAPFRMAAIHGLSLTERRKEVDFRSGPELMLELLLSYAD